MEVVICYLRLYSDKYYLQFVTLNIDIFQFDIPNPIYIGKNGLVSFMLNFRAALASVPDKIVALRIFHYRSVYVTI